MQCTRSKESLAVTDAVQDATFKNYPLTTLSDAIRFKDIYKWPVITKGSLMNKSPFVIRATRYARVTKSRVPRFILRRNIHIIPLSEIG